MALRTIVLREFGAEGLTSFAQFRACILLLAEERLGSKAREAGYREDDQVHKLRTAMDPPDR